MTTLLVISYLITWVDILYSLWKAPIEEEVQEEVE